jgi:hypothetical protein
MKQVTEKQIEAIQNLSRATKTTVNDVDKMSSLEASQVITALIENLNAMKQKRSNANSNTSYNKAHDYKSDALAGLAVKILAQRCKVDEIISKAENFKQRAAELYKVFDSARRECLA